MKPYEASTPFGEYWTCAISCRRVPNKQTNNNINISINNSNTNTTTINNNINDKHSIHQRH